MVPRLAAGGYNGNVMASSTVQTHVSMFRVENRLQDASFSWGANRPPAGASRRNGGVPARSLGIRLFVPMVAVVFFSANAVGGDTQVAWATGPVLQKNLAAPVDIFWADNPLRQAVQNLSRARRVAVLIDRRVDPGRKLNISLRDVALDTALKTIAAECGLGVARLDSVVYLGPPDAAERLDALASAFAKEIQRYPAAIQRKYRQAQPIAWDDLAEPRALLARLAAENGLEIINLELIPHDLWAAADLPPLSLVDRLALIAIQFDMAFKTSSHGERLELVPIPADAPRTTKVARPAPGPRPTPKRPPNATTLPAIDRVAVQEKPLGPVLEQLASRLNLELKIDRDAVAAAGISLDRRVSVRAEKVSVDELLDRLLEGTGLTYTRRGRVVEVFPK